MSRLFDALLGLPETPTGYTPVIPDTVSNIGEAFWEFREDSGGARVFAPRYPPARVLAIPSIMTVAVGVGIIAGFCWPHMLFGHAKTAAIVLAAPGSMGLVVLWVMVLMGNLEECANADVLRCDERSIAFPRGATRISRDEVRRVELAFFALKHRRGWTCLCDLVLVHGNGADVYEVVLRGRRKRIGAALAAYLGVPFTRTNAGRYDWALKQRII